jgi:WD40 repeat protein
MVVEWRMNGEEDGEMLAKVTNSVYALLTIHETDQLIVGHNYDGIHIIDLKARKETGSINLTDSQIFDIKYHRGVLWIATGNGEIVMVELKSFKIINRVSFSPKSVRCLEIIGDNLFAGYSDNCIRVIDLNNMQLKHTWEAHKNSVFSLRGNPSGDWIISGGRDAHLMVWENGPDYKQITSIVAHMYTINSIAFNSTGTHFVTGSMDKTIKLWDAREFKLLKVIDMARFGGHSSSVNKLVWSNYKNRVISCSDDRTISLWDMNIR